MKFLIVVLGRPVVGARLLQNQRTVVKASSQRIPLWLLQGREEDERFDQRSDGALGIESSVESLKSWITSSHVGAM